MERFDAVVVGSGFGGSVMAYRLAAAGMRVLVLERGAEYEPGKFARTPGQMSDNLWDPSAGKQGLLNVWSFRGIDAVVSAGLGGGSLIYANVLLRKDPKWFIKEDLHHGYERWPITYDDLEAHYGRVEAMLGAQPYPFDSEHHREIPKAEALHAAGHKLGYEVKRLNLAVAFANDGKPPRPGEPLIDRDGHNRRGHLRQTCRLCSECVLGCNYGAKQTLDMTYLSAADATGNAEIRTKHEVRTIRRDDRGWIASYVIHGDPTGEPTPTRELRRREVRARYLIVAAGAFGSTFLLLRSRREHPDSFAAVSPLLGTRFSGNGDVLTFVVGDDRSTRLDPTRGPTITSALVIPDEVDGGDGRGFYVEDAGYPDFVAWLAEALPGRSWLRSLRFAVRYLLGAFGLRRDTDLGAELSEALGAAAFSDRSMPLLSMGRDVPDGTMSLAGDRLELDWTLERSAAYLDRVLGVSREIAEALDRDFGGNPLHYLRRLITVHPLGGCPMGESPETGVVSAEGEMFGAGDLFVVDGAAMPGPTGANPALTIAAFADRCADRLLHRHGGTSS